MHLTLKSCCQLLIHLGELGREELHTGTGGMYRRRRRRRRLPQKGSASHPVKSSISSATTNSKSRASLLAFIVIWKVKRTKRIKQKGIEKLHFLVGLPIRPWDNWMFSFKAMSHKSSWEIPKCDYPTEISDCKSSASIALTESCYKPMTSSCKQENGCTNLRDLLVGRGNKSWSWSPDALISAAPHNYIARSF